MTRRPIVARVLLVSATAAALVHWRQRVAAPASGLRHPHEWVARVGVDAAVAALATPLAWCAALWLAVIVVLGFLVRVPGRVGGWAERLAASMLPRMLHRLVGVGIGVTAATAATAVPALAQAAPSVAAHSSVHAERAERAIGWLPSPAAPQHDVPSLDDAPAVPVRHVPAKPIPVPMTYHVRTNDSLWAIAARCRPGSADGDVAAAWPAWYAANRASIGPDPAHLLPGETLQIPDSGCSGDTR